MGYIHHQPLSESEEGPFNSSDECIVKTYFEDVIFFFTIVWLSIFPIVPTWEPWLPDAVELETNS